MAADDGFSVSVVIPLYSVEKYLPDLLRSLSEQQVGSYRLELIFVDDGSPDRSAEIAAEWLADSRFDGVVLRQENAGVSAARNAGLDAATAEWVTFPDSDDFLSGSYFADVARFAQRHADDATILSTRLLRLHEPDPIPRDVHALGFRFAAGNRVVSMREHPDFFQLNVASAFFRVGQLRQVGARFAAGLHASEDALFTAAFLATVAEPRLGLVADAEYVYRRREAGDSAVDQFRSRPDTYIERFRDGYAPLMSRLDAVPAWLQSMFLYECQWILPAQLTEEGYASVLDEAQRAEARDALAACARHVSEARLFGYDATALPLESRLLLNALAGRGVPDWVGAYLTRSGRDLLAYTAAAGELQIAGRDGVYRAVTDRDVAFPDYFGQQVLGAVRATVDGDLRRVRVDGRDRRVVRQGPLASMAEVLDRDRRRHYGARHAMSARATEVRVWKAVPGPGGRLAPRLQHALHVERMRWRRLRTRSIRRLRRAVARRLRGR